MYVFVKMNNSSDSNLLVINAPLTLTLFEELFSDVTRNMTVFRVLQLPKRTHYLTTLPELRDG